MPNQEVYVRPFPADPAGGKWQISSGGGNYPLWSRNGRELFYLGPNGIMVVSYTAKGASFVPDKPRLWSDHRIFNAFGSKNYDLAPDGKRFAVLELPEREQKPETTRPFCSTSSTRCAAARRRAGSKIPPAKSAFRRVATVG
jgi:hypothetical protein